MNNIMFRILVGSIWIGAYDVYFVGKIYAL